MKIKSEDWMRLRRRPNRCGHKALVRATRRYRHEFLHNVLMPKADTHSEIGLLCSMLEKSLTRLRDASWVTGTEKRARFNECLDIYSCAVTGA